MPELRQQVDKLVGRTLSEDESRIVTWLEGWDTYTVGAIQLLLLGAYHNGQKTAKQRSEDEDQAQLVHVLIAADVEFNLDVTGLHFVSEADEERGQRIAAAMKLSYLLE